MTSAKKLKNRPTDEVQLQLLYGDDSCFMYWESHLFNEVYLRRDLPENHADKWNETESLSFQHFMNTLRNLATEYNERERELTNWSETETINNWVKHVLDGLGWKNNCTGIQNPFLEETSFRYDDKTFRTDILIVDHPKEKQYINQAKGDDKLVEARSSVIMPVEVKYWQRLEEYRQGKKEISKRRDNDADDLERTASPNEQTTQYMNMLNQNWGILTDGAKWRLFNIELSSEDPNRYYEFNLCSLIESINTEETESDSREVLEAAKYFYHFFSKEAFASTDEKQESFVAEILKYSKKYVGKVEEDLKERFVKAMNIACNGFFKIAGKNNLPENLPTLRNVAESTLFNILFIKSLESRGVLPLNSTDYKKISLSNIIDKIERFDPDKDDLLNVREMDRAFRKGNGNSFTYHPKGLELHDRIVRLNMAIHDGSSSRDSFGFEIVGFRQSIFNDAEWMFFKNNKLSNEEWVKILFQLGYAESESLSRKYQQIPYSYFTPRQLGSIYESFLEYKLDKATEDLIYIKKQWKPADLESRKYKMSGLPKVRKNELFFTPDNKDRKASGSYYTPDYIVRYILEQTLSPLIKGRSAKEILQLRICDPAMGSGHFLVGALNYLAKAYLIRLEKESKGDLAETVLDAKSEILRSCIFGVDLNPRAVKLAKMSLWLETARINEKSFSLEGRLQDGDSLITKMSNYEYAFDWQTKVFKKNGFKSFDGIIGNPPYSFGRDWNEQGRAEDFKTHFKKNYSTAEYQLDLFSLFIERSFQLCATESRIGLIVPSVWLNNLYSVGMRKFVLQSSSDLKITKTIEEVFAEATIDTVILSCAAGNGADNAFTVIGLENGVVIQKSDVEKAPYLSGEKPIQTQIGTADSEWTTSMSQSSVKMGDVLDITRGVHSYRVGGYGKTVSGRGPQTKQDVENRPYHKAKPSLGFKPFYYGKDIGLLNTLSPREFVKYGDWLAEPRKPSFFEGSRVYLRQIMGDRLHAAAVTDGSVVDQSVYILKSRDNKYSSEFISGVLSSTLLSEFCRHYFNKKRAAFPYLKVGEIKQIPLPDLTNPKKKALADELVNEVSKLRKNTAEKVNFLRLEKIVADLYEIKISHSSKLKDAG